MGSHGKPEVTTQQFGEEVAKIRTARRLSRSKLVTRMIQLRRDEMDNTKLIDAEPKLRSLENGQLVKISRSEIEQILDALTCSQAERAHLMYHADRNPLMAQDDREAKVAIVLSAAMTHIFRDPNTFQLLAQLAEQHWRTSLSDAELSEITNTAIELIAKCRYKDTLVPEGG